MSSLSEFWIIQIVGNIASSDGMRVLSIAILIAFRPRRVQQPKICFSTPIVATIFRVAHRLCAFPSCSCLISIILKHIVTRVFKNRQNSSTPSKSLILRLDSHLHWRKKCVIQAILADFAHPPTASQWPMTRNISLLVDTEIALELWPMSHDFQEDDVQHSIQCLFVCVWHRNTHLWVSRYFLSWENWRSIQSVSRCYLKPYCLLSSLRALEYFEENRVLRYRASLSENVSDNVLYRKEKTQKEWRRQCSQLLELAAHRVGEDKGTDRSCDISCGRAKAMLSCFRCRSTLWQFDASCML